MLMLRLRNILKVIFLNTYLNIYLFLLKNLMIASLLLDGWKPSFKILAKALILGFKQSSLLYILEFSLFYVNTTSDSNI